MNLQLNTRAKRLFDLTLAQTEHYKIASHSIGSATVLDFGCKSAGGLAAGRRLAEICLADLGSVEIGTICTKTGLPQVIVQTDHPVQACLMSQYAGWKIDTDGYFAMGSGPMRASAATEEIFREFPAGITEQCAVGVLEGGKLPSAAAVAQISESLAAGCQIFLAVAPTASQAGNVQVVARSVETALHKLHEIGFPMDTIQSGYGSCPLPPVAADDLKGIGRTNDAILYAATVHLWVNTEDDLLQHLGPKTPSNSSAAFGESFLSLFKQANYNFYDIDKNLFSPAVITFHNQSTGNTFTFGEHRLDVVFESLGLSEQGV
ncbi:MAG: methenyltetrahydromethanopterin cyclohydrolase [Fuerstiella sp.]